MKPYVWPATILLCVVAIVGGAPFTIRALREPVGPVDVKPAPVESKFADEIAAAWRANGGVSDDACVLVEIYTALQSTLARVSVREPQLDTEQLARITKLGNDIAFGTEKPFGDKYKFLNDLMRAELLKRGLSTDKDGDGKHEVTPLNYEGWLKFYSDVIEGLSQ